MQARIRDLSEIATFGERVRDEAGKAGKTREKEREYRSKTSPRPQTSYLAHTACFKITLITCQIFIN